MRTADEFKNIRPGDVVVLKEVDVDHIEEVRNATAILAEEPGMTSYTAIIGREMDIPVVVGVRNATRTFQDGMKVTVDAVRGLIYEGFINLPSD